MKKIRKAVIPAAGFGTRFLPATKAMPKEMLPIDGKPVIQYVVEECIASGIEEIILVTGYHKRSIEDHFDRASSDLVHMLEEGGEKKKPLLDEVQRIADMANFVYIRQKGGYGNGTPVLNAKDLIGDEPFAVLWGDEFIYSNPPRLQQCIEVYEKYGNPVISGIEVSDVTRYGIADLELVENNVFKLNRLVEKPSKESAPSNIGLIGCYIFNPDIFDYLAALTPGQGGEIWLTDAIAKYMDHKNVYTCVVENGRYYDTGNKLEYMKTTVDFALKNEEYGQEFREYLNKLICE